MENSTIFELLNKTACCLDAPELFGRCHIDSALAAIAAAVWAAVLFARRSRSSGDSRAALVRTLAGTGWLLLILEIYKQLFLYYIVNGGAYDWWFFPFQLCSVPMYMCILLPFVGDRLRSVFLTFMCGYTFVSAAASLIYPADFLREYVSLTIHGFIWHGVLLFISLLIILTGSADASVRGLLKAFGLFCGLSVIAVIINMAVEPAMQTIHAQHSAVAHDWAAMFYLNPYHTSPQPIVGSIQNAVGIVPGLILYALAAAAAGSLVAFLASRLRPAD